VLLLDEPLAALDAQTRRVVRDELVAELRALAIPTLLVTHDFGDASALADRVAIIVDGHVKQLGAPSDLTSAPVDAFVVAFTGGSVLRGTGRGRVVELAGGRSVAVDADVSGPVELGLYPWEVEVRPGPGPDGALRGTVVAAVVEGGRARVRVDEWSGEAVAPDGLAPGAIAHGIPRRTHVLSGRTIRS
jgi:molybdate transport system ATP-binding protein